MRGLKGLVSTSNGDYELAQRKAEETDLPLPIKKFSPGFFDNINKIRALGWVLWEEITPAKVSDRRHIFAQVDWDRCPVVSTSIMAGNFVEELKAAADKKKAEIAAKLLSTIPVPEGVGVDNATVPTPATAATPSEPANAPLSDKAAGKRVAVPQPKRKRKPADVLKAQKRAHNATLTIREPIEGDVVASPPRIEDPNPDQAVVEKGDEDIGVSQGIVVREDADEEVNDDEEGEKGEYAPSERYGEDAAVSFDFHYDNVLRLYEDPEACGDLVRRLVPLWSFNDDRMGEIKSSVFDDFATSFIRTGMLGNHMLRYFQLKVMQAREATNEMKQYADKTRHLYLEEKKKVKKLTEVGETLDLQAQEAHSLAERATAEMKLSVAKNDALRAENEKLHLRNAELDQQIDGLRVDLKMLATRYDEANKERSHVLRKFDSLLKEKVNEVDASWRAFAEERFTKVRRYLEETRLARPLDDTIACYQKCGDIFDLIKGFGGSVPDLVGEALKEQLKMKRDEREKLAITELTEDDLAVPVGREEEVQKSVEDEASSAQPAGASNVPEDGGV